MAPPMDMRFGLVTYMWGSDQELLPLLKTCEKAGISGVELRTTHLHGVEPTLTGPQRAQVSALFENGPVALVGLGSNEKFDWPDPQRLGQAMEETRAFIRLSHDVGGTGVKVKPDGFHEGVPREKTIEQIGKSLNELGAFASDFGQTLRLEVHGGCAELPTIKAIMAIADHPNVGICWNCNPQDLEGQGLEGNFRLVRDRFGETLHIHDLRSQDYPYPKLAGLLRASDYDGWILLEEGKKPEGDLAQALIEQRLLWEKMAGP